jgi:hypothetical protein
VSRTLLGRFRACRSSEEPGTICETYISSVLDGRIERLARGQWVTTTCDSLSLYTQETKKPAILFGERARSATTRPLDYTHLRLIDRANGGISMAFARIAPEVRSEGCQGPKLHSIFPIVPFFATCKNYFASPSELCVCVGAGFRSFAKYRKKRSSCFHWRPRSPTGTMSIAFPRFSNDRSTSMTFRLVAQS